MGKVIVLINTEQRKHLVEKKMLQADFLEENNIHHFWSKDFNLEKLEQKDSPIHLVYVLPSQNEARLNSRLAGFKKYGYEKEDLRGKPNDFVIAKLKALIGKDKPLMIATPSKLEAKAEQIERHVLEKRLIVISEERFKVLGGKSYLENKTGRSRVMKVKKVEPSIQRKIMKEATRFDDFYLIVNEAEWRRIMNNKALLSDVFKVLGQTQFSMSSNNVADKKAEEETISLVVQFDKHVNMFSPPAQPIRSSFWSRPLSPVTPRNKPRRGFPSFSSPDISSGNFISTNTLALNLGSASPESKTSDTRKPMRPPSPVTTPSQRFAKRVRIISEDDRDSLLDRGYLRKGALLSIELGEGVKPDALIEHVIETISSAKGSITDFLFTVNKRDWLNIKSDQPLMTELKKALPKTSTYQWAVEIGPDVQDFTPAPTPNTGDSHASLSLMSPTLMSGRRLDFSPSQDNDDAESRALSYPGWTMGGK